MMRPPAIRRLTDVIEVEYAYGRGLPDDPVRSRYAYFDSDGNLLAERDADWQSWTFTGTSSPFGAPEPATSTEDEA